jgi:RNA polymerase sigma-70 factor (ECF subfamily)
MPPRMPDEVTGLLLAWSQGDEGALQKLVPMVYEELRRLAHHYMSQERTGHTLQTTALVHEAYQRLIDTPHVRWNDRIHFFAVCAQLMRRILVDHARSRGYLKRGGGAPIVSLDEAAELAAGPSTDLLAIDAALTALAGMDPRKAQVVELRFFGGLTVEETAAVLKVSSDTVHRDWKLAKVWLLGELEGRQPHGA